MPHFTIPNVGFKLVEFLVHIGTVWVSLAVVGGLYQFLTDSNQAAGM